MSEHVEKITEALNYVYMSMHNMSDIIKIAGKRITQLEKEIDEIKLVMRANEVIK